MVVKWFYVCGIPAHVHSNKGNSFDNEIMTHLHAMYRVEQTATMPYNPHGNAPTERLNHTLIGCSNHYPRSRRAIGHYIYHHWYLHIMPCCMIQLASSHMSWCLDAKHQLFAIHGSVWQVKMTTFCKASVLGLINSIGSSLLQIGRHWKE